MAVPGEGARAAGPSGSGAARAVLAVARHPSLWPTAAAQVLRLAPRGWWRRAPFVPVPDPAYLRYRLETQYGTGAGPDPEDVVTFLRWCRALPRAGRP